MTYRLVHLHLTTYGAPTTLATIDAAVGLAKAFSASLEITSPRLDVKAPSHFLAGRMLAGLAADLESAAAAKAKALDTHAEARAGAASVPLAITPVAETWPQQGEDITVHGRTSDICVLTLPCDKPEQRLNAEAWLFGAGRPCFLIPEPHAAGYSAATCCIAWDGSKSAARAIGDALPILRRAQRVIIVTGRNEKPLAQDILAPLVAYLQVHGITAEPQEIDVAGENIGDVLLSAVDRNKADLLIMGAYGHSRLREFILGGATRRILDLTRVPLLMSH
ncbi:MAG: universal stress protein [Hyphomonadaceae bacterium]|nr:universal stress protein [Hyphomonadaceae bacterium]